MNSLEASLKDTLDKHPENWAVRLLVIEQMQQRGADEEVVAMVTSSPTPPETPEDLHRVVELAGAEAIHLVSAYVLQHPADAYGHELLGTIHAWQGDDNRAQQHNFVAESLDSSGERLLTGPDQSVFGQDGPAAEVELPPPLDIPPPHQNPGKGPIDFGTSFARNAAPPRRKSPKATAILAAIGFHLVILFIAALVVILPQMKDDPEIVAAIAPPITKKQEMQKKNVVKQTKKTSSSAAAAAPLAQLMRANAVARISLPNVTKTSRGPLGIGEADFGGGGFGSGGGGMGSGETMFGSQSGSGLIGSFYDLKQDRARKATGITGDSVQKYNEVMQKAARSKFSPSAFSGFFKARIELRFGVLAIPTVPAEMGPGAFAVEKEVQPRAWLVHYTGRVEPPQRGKWRFVGFFDDALVVFVNGRCVLDASWMPCFNEDGVRQPFGGPALANGKPAVFGNWVVLDSPFQIDILVGERPGGHMGGALLAEWEKGSYRKRNDGTPILPLFSTGELDSATAKRIKDYPYEFDKDVAIFRTARSGF